MGGTRPANKQLGAKGEDLFSQRRHIKNDGQRYGGLTECTGANVLFPRSTQSLHQQLRPARILEANNFYRAEITEAHHYNLPTLTPPSDNSRVSHSHLIDSVTIMQGS